MSTAPAIYFSDFFGVSRVKLEEYGALDISLLSDLPLFIDPFLLFGSNKADYQSLHNEIIRYIVFLRDKARNSQVSKGLIDAWFTFPEEKGNWLGYSAESNKGHGLGGKFAKALNDNLSTVFRDFGRETIPQSSHLEKLGLIRSGVGRDNISDLTTNIIKRFLLNFTEKFALENIRPEFLDDFQVEKVYFDYKIERWMPQKFTLPSFGGEYVILTPKDILTKDEMWINRSDLNQRFKAIVNSVSDISLREQASSSC